MGRPQPSRPGRNAPAQNTSPYTALKFSGSIPGTRVNASTNINTTANAGFSFTAHDDTPCRRLDKSAAQNAPAVRDPARRRRPARCQQTGGPGLPPDQG